MSALRLMYPLHEAGPNEDTSVTVQYAGCKSGREFPIMKTNTFLAVSSLTERQAGGASPRLGFCFSMKTK